jgi:hypothetical protein
MTVSMIPSNSASIFVIYKQGLLGEAGIGSLSGTWLLRLQCGVRTAVN